MKRGASLPAPIKESILRFPSAPIHGLHRLHEYHVNIGKSESFHTYRVLTSAKRRRTERVRRIFLMHNGLNEAESMGLYYRLASHLIQQDESGGTACILRPFPGHLTRSRFAGFAETPLDHYLWDGIAPLSPVSPLHDRDPVAPQRHRPALVLPLYLRPQPSRRG